MKKLAILLSAFCILQINLAAKTITVYHTGDVHGWYSARPAKWDKENSTRMIGGFAALSSLVKREKNPYILLDSGDMFQGTPEGNLTRGMATVTLMNQLNYSAALVGNHEYDYGEDNLKVLISSSAFPWLGGNVYLKDAGKPVDYLKPYIIVEKAGKKIAVIGIAGRHTKTTTLPRFVEHLDFRSETAEAARWTGEVKKLNPDAIVILAHVGFDAGLIGQKTDISTWTFAVQEMNDGTPAIAKAAAGANVVLGGHNHTGLMKGYQDKQSGSLLAESYSELTDVGKIDLEFDDSSGKFTGAGAELIALWTDITGEDPEVIKTIKGFNATTEKAMEVALGSSEADLVYNPEGLDSPIGNWMTDAMRRQSGADMAFQNTSGIRSELKKGAIKMRDIYQVMPFENTAVKLKMTGEQLRKLLSDNFRNGRARMQLSGLTVKFKLSTEGKPAGLTLEKDGRAISSADEFTVVTNNYLTTGGSGGRAFTEGKDMQDTMLPVRDLLIKEIKENSPVKMPVMGRYIKLD
ncbi:MAG: bifunctional metallophosphatase/5'-nucleotidase [Elusimicrobia bacterium]|nr:bifunctional metallophosphatase/5'-nucleotidase [Elusimicrobiota bacterium]